MRRIVLNRRRHRRSRNPAPEPDPPPDGRGGTTYTTSAPKKGIEHEMIARIPGVAYHVVKSGKLAPLFQRTELYRPLPRAARRILVRSADAQAEARRMLFPRAVFVSVPVVVGAWLAHVPHRVP